MIRRLLAILLLAAAAFAQIPEGIPRQLARDRAANIIDVHYKLTFNLTPKSPDVPGKAEISFTLKAAKDTLLDYRDGYVRSLNVNGDALNIQNENGHIFRPPASLHNGPNTVAIEFTSHAAPAGKPIIRYEDKDDGSEY